MLDWIEQVNQISLRSNYCFQQLGLLAPNKFTERARNWFLFLPQNTRDHIQQDWATLREALATHFLNRNWYNTQKSRALSARFRQNGFQSERPSDYLYRKVKMLKTIGNWTQPELIIEVM